MKKLICTGLIAISIFGFEHSGISEENENVNLLPNPGFEEGETLPNGWKTYQDGAASATFIWDKENSHSGKYSVLLLNKEKEGTMAWLCSCNLKSETTYKFSAWVKIQKENKNSRGAVYIRARGAAEGMAKKWDVSEGCKITPSGEWQQITWEFKTPAGLKPNTVIWLWSMKGDGDKVWFDDVELKEVSK